MSNRYKGAVISATPPTTTGGEEGTASGAWTLEQQMQLQAAGLWPSQPPPPYIEDVFSTYLYTGNGSTQTITNNINITGKGALVWLKKRSGSGYHIWTDTARGAGLNLSSNVAIPQYNDGQPTFNNNGFNLINNNPDYNASASTYVSWTFRKQPKFFDVVTYTGNQAVGRAISHSLGSTPGCVIVKCTTEERSWFVYHRSIGATKHLILSDTGAEITQTDIWNNTTPTSTTFTVGDSSNVNGSGRTYVAYLFAHDAGGFGLTETDNVISCGSFTASSGAATVDIGYEPQWILFKRTNGAEGWNLVDNMRGWSYSATALLQANTSGAEDPNGLIANPTATGFQFGTGTLAASGTYIYIAIRRGPMKVPTDATKVFTPLAVTVPPYSVTAGFPVDLALFGKRSGTNANRWLMLDRLRGGQPALLTSSTAAENNTYASSFASNTQFTDGWSSSGYANVYELFQRAPSFFDEVCYTGAGGTNRQVTHNLGVQPQLYIVKRRNGTKGWFVGSTLLSGSDYYMYLDLNVAQDSSAGASDVWGTSFPTSNYFLVSDTNGYNNTNTSGDTYVAYLFATCAGVSKVGSYTGTATTKQIDCGFTAGSRFVLIKRTDSTGDWYVWDSARGIIAGNDPYLLLNSTAAEVTNTDYIDTYSAGFEISSTAPSAINASGGTFIFLAIA